MKRAAELFKISRRASSSPFVDETWWTRSEPEKAFVSVAVIHWEMGRHTAAGRGPTDGARARDEGNDGGDP